MRLVVIAADIGDLRPAEVDMAADEPGGAVEAQHPRGGFRRQPDLPAKPLDQPLAAPAEILCDGADGGVAMGRPEPAPRSEEHTSELQSLIRNSSAVFCLKKKNTTCRTKTHNNPNHTHTNNTRMSEH